MAALKNTTYTKAPAQDQKKTGNPATNNLSLQNTSQKKQNKKYQ